MPSFPPFLPTSLHTSFSGAEIDRVVDAFTEDGAITMQYLIDADYTEDDLVRARPPSLHPSLPPSHMSFLCVSASLILRSISSFPPTDANSQSLLSTFLPPSLPLLLS